MKTEYAQRDGESPVNWLKRLYEMAAKTASERGWMGNDPELIGILLNNMGTLLK